MFFPSFLFTYSFKNVPCHWTCSSSDGIEMCFFCLEFLANRLCLHHGFPRAAGQPPALLGNLGLFPFVMTFPFRDYINESVCVKRALGHIQRKKNFTFVIFLLSKSYSIASYSYSNTAVLSCS